MVRLFLDTNVVLDTIVPGRPGCEASQRLMSLGHADGYELCVSYLTVADMAYVIRKGGVEMCRGKAGRIADICHVLPMNDMQLHYAERVDSTDYEDSLQISCADLEGCDCIITHNAAHFKDCTVIPVYSPEEFLAKIIG